MNTKYMEWVLRVSVFGTFFGHGVLALQGKLEWIRWIMDFGGWEPVVASKLLFAVGVLDVLVALSALLKPVRAVLLWAMLWAFWTSFMRVLPFIGGPVWDFVERWASIGAPLALLLLYGWPTTLREWFR